jgi:hypothetical protein
VAILQREGAQGGACHGRANGDGRSGLGSAEGACAREVASLPFCRRRAPDGATRRAADRRGGPRQVAGMTLMRRGACAAWEGVEPREGAVSEWRGLGMRPVGSDAEGAGRWRAGSAAPACAGRRVGNVTARARVLASVNAVYSCLTEFISKFLN